MKLNDIGLENSGSDRLKMLGHVLELFDDARIPSLRCLRVQLLDKVRAQGSGRSNGLLFSRFDSNISSLRSTCRCSRLVSHKARAACQAHAKTSKVRSPTKASGAGHMWSHVPDHHSAPVGTERQVHSDVQCWCTAAPG